MRFTKQKRHRKIVRFYTACFGFREPFKVLCDGTFVHHLISNQLSPDSSVSSALAAPIQLFTTQCVIEELKSLGSSHAKSFHIARKDYRLARCEHDQKVTAFDCIVDIIGDDNPEHFFVASQDKDLRLKCQKIPGVPVMYGLRNALFLEQFSSVQRQFVKASEAERSNVTDSERKLLQKNVKKILSAKLEGSAEEGNEDDVSGHLDFENRKAPKRGMEVKDRVQFKRNKAKGPNPLSCKKKKKSSIPGSNSGENDKAGSDAHRSRRRKRNRTRKARTAAGAVGGST